MADLEFKYRKASFFINRGMCRIHRLEDVVTSSVARMEAAILAARTDDFANLPIHRLPKYTLAWHRPRPEAKALAKALAARLATADKPKGRAKALGGPRIKPGKSRRHGGYGIG